MYQFLLDGILLPVTPDALNVKIANQNKTVTLINEGEINFLKRPGLSKITFSALLPNTQYNFSQYVSGYQPAEFYLNKLEALKNSLQPFKFNVVRATSNLSVSSFVSEFDVSLEDYTIEEDAKKYGTDVAVSITLLQYREFKTRTVVFEKTETETLATTEEERDTSDKEETTDYTVVSGDNLWDIAKKHLNDGLRYTEIYELNKDTIEEAAKKYGRASSSNGHWIYPGTVLKLPA